MNMSVENEVFEDTSVNQTQSGIGALAQAIRRSMVFFLIAAILLILGLFLIFNRVSALSEIALLKSQVDNLSTTVLELRTIEKDFEKTSSETYVIEHNKLMSEAQALVNELSDNSTLTKETGDFTNLINNGLSIYRNLFTQAADSYLIRGFGAQTGINKELREISIAINDRVNRIDNLNIKTALLETRGASKDFVIFETQQFVPPVMKAFNNFESVLSNELAKEQISSESYEVLKQLVANYQDSFNRYAEATLKAAGAFDDTTIASNAVINPIPAVRERLLELQQEASRQVIYILIAVALVLIAIFLIVVWQLRRAQSATAQTLDDTRAAQQAAEEENERLNDSVINILQAVSLLSERDLTARAPVTEDVIGTVSDSINLLADETSVVLKNVTNIAGQVSLVSDTVHTQAEQVSQTAEEERRNVQNMIETLFDATQTMNQVAALAEQSNESAAQATEATENALATVNQTVGGMESIRETISETEKRIKRLGERSQEISGIVNLINTISERTHVLALNASMQAAVAGEAGRGFAVVAEEVQQLAESSRNATEQIATLVNNIQIETNETINTVNRTIGQVVEGSEHAQQAGEQMRKTQEITAELVGRVQNIALASQQQKDMSAQLLEAVQAIGDSTEKTAAQIDAQNTGTEELQKAAKQLVDSVNVFKLPA